MTQPGAATALIRSPNGETTRTADPAAITAALEDANALLWVDLLIRSEADGELLRQPFGFHPLTIEDCVSPRVDAAKVDDYGSYIFGVVQALTTYTPNVEIEGVEVDFYLGKHYVVSCHREPVPAIDAFRERCEKDDHVLNHSADWLLHGLLDALVDEYLPIVDAVDDTIDELETQILHHPDTTHLQSILLVKRNALRLRRAAIPQRDIMNRLSRGEFPALIGQGVQIYYRDVYDHLVRIEYLVEALRDLADGALQTYLSVVSNRLNEVMKVLTAAATLFLPLTVITGVYGMNFEDNQFPSFTDAWGFPVIIAIMMLNSVLMLAYFRYRKWI